MTSERRTAADHYDAAPRQPWDRTAPASDVYRYVFGRVPTSVAIITAMDGTDPVGVSVGSFTSVSLEPPLVGFFIASSSTTWPRIERSGGFCASVLSSDQTETCLLFATKGADRFSGCNWYTSDSGRPVIHGAVAWIDCTIESTAPAGDHVLVLGAADALGAHRDASPLVFLGGRYGGFTPNGE